MPGARRSRCSARSPRLRAEIIVSDDGQGLRGRREDSHGLEIMAERARLIEGRSPSSRASRVARSCPSPDRRRSTRDDSTVADAASTVENPPDHGACPATVSKHLVRLALMSADAATTSGSCRRRPRADPPRTGRGLRPRARHDRRRRRRQRHRGARGLRRAAPARGRHRPPAARRHGPRHHPGRSARDEPAGRPRRGHHALRRRADLRGHGGRRLGLRRQGRAQRRGREGREARCGVAPLVPVRGPGRRDDAPRRPRSPPGSPTASTRSWCSWPTAWAPAASPRSST